MSPNMYRIAKETLIAALELANKNNFRVGHALDASRASIGEVMLALVRMHKQVGLPKELLLCMIEVAWELDNHQLSRVLGKDAS